VDELENSRSFSWMNNFRIYNGPMQRKWWRYKRKIHSEDVLLD
jgi:hypothetical protein